MFASYLTSPIAFGLAAGLALTCIPHAVAAPICKPALAFRDISFSATHPETMERTWTAALSVDASRCATASGHFEILFSRQKENGPEVTFAEPFNWTPGVTEVSVQFWADEAVEAFWLHNVAACPCRD